MSTIDCNICYLPARQIHKRPKCAHRYHPRCLDLWESKNPHWDGSCFHCFKQLRRRSSPQPPNTEYLDEEEDRLRNLISMADDGADPYNEGNSLAKYGIRRCANEDCRVPIQKVGGCIFVLCTACGYYFDFYRARRFRTKPSSWDDYKFRALVVVCGIAGYICATAWSVTSGNSR